MKVTRFEDLIAWQKARELAREVYKVTRKGRLAHNFKLSGQMQEASVSVMANVAEGFERHTAAEFHHFVSVSKSSCAELRSHLYAAFDIGDMEEPEFARLLGLAEEVGRILGGLRAAVERRKNHR
jgi:four helix bundle protein